MPLIKNGTEIENEWNSLAEGEKFDGQPNTLLSLQEFHNNYETIKDSNSIVGVALTVDDEVDSLEGKLDQVALVTVHFPSFADGRGFSQARLVRERFAFTGEIRAVGHIIRDQYLYLVRSGVDSVDADRATEAEWKAAIEEFDTFYQPALNKGTAAYRLRNKKQAAAA
ncbi:DUF934 domain-containing protein [Curvivirga aplysinae]|uniref:DUF934 domain-containing protein n=1 Tax=Curvivirga aplysinae TaxID=2529852 RepID=UPI0012BB86A6|nr:DUF934 domain-containing protein [Curvivirga aplysinae]MTI09038.1 DUF934 domain-containing protein [Curvivirga aplysinae]